jgi:RNA polymerase sigma factor (sigma-70 family)
MDTKKPFESIVTEHSSTVLRVCRAVVGVHDAEDAWAETFLAALRAYPDLPADANVEAWLVRIAHRKAIDIIRSERRRAVPVDEVPEGPSSLGIPDADQQELWGAVKSLPPKQRRAVAYRYVAGLPYSEIAALIGGSADAARRAAADGISTLRSIYPSALAEGESR